MPQSFAEISPRFSALVLRLGGKSIIFSSLPIFGFLLKNTG